MLKEKLSRLPSRSLSCLFFLLSTRDRPLAGSSFLNLFGGMDYHGSLRTVDTHIKTLRMKLGTGDYIQTIWGVGYKFEVPAT
ncbi:winged helix-turn-helix domain-containing protein [Mesobacillus subterraneus]|uniref:winged helix-turn-helix domain-containing protein n=1 Tax=Mesobacillus subterraneus TaxID=285983 RepID=UPI00353266DB